MIEIKTFQCNMLPVNCYIVSDETKECMVVDCGALYEEEQQAIDKYITDNGLKPVLSVLTHGHIDHTFGCKYLFDKYGLKPVLGRSDEKLYYAANEQAQGFFQMNLDYEMPAIERLVKDGDEVKFGNTSFKVIETPGHTQGCVFYYSEKENVAFSGDTLFRGSIGRVDLPGGSMFQITMSLRQITQLPDETQVFPGHGEETTIGYELATNMYLDR